MKLFVFEPRSYSCDQYLDAVCEAEERCCYGHWGCAAWRGGPCSDEILAAVERAMQEHESAEENGWPYADEGGADNK